MLNLKNDERECIICFEAAHYFLTKTYQETDVFQINLTVDYYKCSHCGFVFSKTHQEMTKQEWNYLNSTFHHHCENNINALSTNQPPYAEQAFVLQILNRSKLIKINNALDYAAGYGTLARILNDFFDLKINLFDPHVTNPSPNLNYTSQSELNSNYNLVINSAMFEHVLHRNDLDVVNNLVSDNGVLMIHTVICETIPKDPNWFYLSPIVHTAFHTNKSMEILMEQWGYAASIYSPQAKSWFLFNLLCEIPHPELIGLGGDG
jgi:hypothetical protein